MLVLYSDGVTEATNANYDEFAEDRFIEVLRKYRNEPSTQNRGGGDESAGTIRGRGSPGRRYHDTGGQARLTCAAELLLCFGLTWLRHNNRPRRRHRQPRPVRPRPSRDRSSTWS